VTSPPAPAGLDSDLKPARARVLAAGPVLVLAVSIALTLVAWQAVETALREKATGEFEEHVREVTTRLRGRMRDDEQVLRGGVGLFAASDEVTREEWRRFVSALRLGENFPGIQGVGFTEWIAPAGLAAHERRVRAEGFPEYAVRPPGPRDAYTAIVYLEPFDWRNQRAFGFDMWSEPVRRAAMARARDSGDAALSGRIVLVQETEKDRQAGVLLYLPVYRSGPHADTVAARREALRGFVYSPIRMKDFVLGAVGRIPAALAFDIRAAGVEGPEALLFDSLQAEPVELPEGYRPDHELVERFEVLGQAWEVRFRSLPAFDTGLGSHAAVVVLLGGLLASALLFAVTLVLARSRARAVALARALREGEERYRTFFETGPDGVVVLDPATLRLLAFNDRACSQLGYTREEFAHLNLADVDASETPVRTAERVARVMAKGGGEFDVLQRDKHGRLRDVHVLARYMTVAGRPVYHSIWRDVTDQRRAEEARRREEARFHSYFDLPLVGAAITSPDRGWITVNDRLCAMLGYTREELGTRTWADLTHAEDLPGEIHLVAEILSGARDGYTLEKRLLRKDGEVVWVSVAIQCVRGDGGKVEYFAGLLDDITARKREEQLSRARMSLMNRALTCTLAELLVATLDEVEELTGSRIGFYHFVHDDGRDLTLQAWSTRTARDFCKAEGHGLHYPVAEAGVWADCVRQRRPVIHNDYAAMPGKKGMPPGHAEVLRELAVPVVREGQIVAVLGIGNKATEYTEADVAVVTRFADLAWDVAERKLVQERLRESDARFAAAFDRAPMMMTLSRLEDGRYLGANQRFLEVSGFTREETVGRTSVELGWISAEERRRLVAVLQAEGRVTGLELALRTRDGRAISARFWGELITVGGQRCLLSIAQDVTREQALQRQLAQAQKLESVGRLAGGVAHDFNNMLSVIQGHADLLLRETDPTAPIHDDLLEIRDAARRAAVVTRQLLAFARKQTVEPRVLDLNETVAGILKMLRRLIGEDIDLQWHPGFELRRVRIDPSQVDQLLANLCVNSRDAIAGVGRVSIQTANAALDEAFCGRHAGLTPGEYVRLTVTDDGSGIPTDALPHIFEPFYTTKETGRGTGLGLATVYGIVSQNGGAIEVESTPGQGATFSLYLPAVREAVAEPAAPAAAEVPRGSETVLLVEDEPAVLKLCTGMLEHLGYRVVAATGAAEAVRLAARHGAEIKLLMTDVVMPDVSGRDLATMLTLGHPGLRCLFMSGYTSETVDRHAVDGAFIQKPFTPEELAVKVREALGRRPAVAVA